jgi:hypothetical protein
MAKAWDEGHKVGYLAGAKMTFQKACCAVCDRCAEGDEPFPPDTAYPSWTHGAYETKSGVGVGPEPCAADAIRKSFRWR